MKVRKTRQTARTWLGIPGVEWEYRFTSNPLGRRVAALRWTEDNPNTGNKAGDLVLRLIDGDGRRPDFTVYEETVIPGGSDAQADEWVTAHG